MAPNRWFERLAAATEVDADRSPGAPARLKARIYSSLMSRLSESGPLCDLAETRASGRALCVFEHLTSVVPIAHVRSFNLCSVCHARVLAERLDRAPIFWSGCPYADFHRD
jgi:hypothetical protein